MWQRSRKSAPIYMADNIFKRGLDTLAKRAGYIKPQEVQKAEEPRFQAFAMAPNRIKQASYLGGEGLPKPSNVTFQTLRKIAKYDSLIRICITVIKKSVSQSKWIITPTEDASTVNQEAIDYFYNLFLKQHQNNENMRLLLDRIIEDLLILDAAVVEKVINPITEQVVGLNSIDGATIKPVYNEFGELGSPAYIQQIQGKTVARFEMNEVIYMMQNPQNDIETFGYGLSPIESILLDVQASLNANLYNAQAFSQDNIPPGILDLGDMDEANALRFQAIWDATVIDNTHKMKFLYGGNDKKYIPLKGNNKDMQFVEYIDWLSRVKLAAFGLTGLDANIIQDVNYSTSKSQRMLSESRGVQSVKRLIEEYFNREIILAMGIEDIEFKFVANENIEERKTQADVDKIYLETGVYTADEIRQRDGLQPLEYVEDEEIEETPEDIDDEQIQNQKPTQKVKKQIKRNFSGKGFYPPLYY